ncbi:NTP transferase domain-containing protein [Alkaliphilus pronyensis]|uniref:NTP transferase domain-containing protein n=2 Tax=Alkaliphilus pronyensis TaxID=1482732 RepID=A0A6I0FF04_9FIRM|nr:NTP transferase domain-containing protein [Alkaliphilus pronyensis]
MITIKAIIMAGGKGTRLRPLTCSLPKPMVPILNKPVMEYTVELLKKHNIKDIAVTMAYLPEIITDYFGDGTKWGVGLKYYLEDIPLGTGGSVRNAEEFINEAFLVISGDALTDLNIKEALEYHRAKASKVTLILKNEPVPIEYGVVITNEEGRIVRFLEKPSWGEVFSNTVNTGIYIIEPEVMEYYQRGDNFDFSKDLFPKLLQDGVAMYGYVTKDYWCDIGDLSSYKETQFDMLEGKVKLNIQGNEVKQGVWLDEGAKLGENTIVNPPVYIGKNTVINGGKIGPYTIVADNCNVYRDTVIKKSVLWRNVIVGNGSHITGSVICNGVFIKNRVNIFENSSVGEDSTLYDGVMVRPDIKIWPNKKIDVNTVVNKNLIWGSKASKTVFGYRDISGHVNIDITPEFAMGLGSSFASINKEGTIIVSDDNTKASLLIKNSIATGIISSGGQAVELTDSVLAINRFAVKYHQAAGGIHVRADSGDENKVYIEFTDKNGASIGRNKEREMENILNRGEFERCNANRIKEKISVTNFSSLFIKHGLSLVKNKDSIKRSSYKIAIASDSPQQLILTKSFLNELGCSVIYDSSLQIKGLNHHLNYLSKEVKLGNVEFGVIINENGEEMILVDEKGREIKEEKLKLLTTLIQIKVEDNGKIVLPYIAPNIFEKIAQSYNVDIIRTKSNPSSIMHEMLNDWDKDYEFPLQYILNYNAIWSLGLIIDLLVSTNSKLSYLVEEIPEYYYLKDAVPCDWTDKGRVIKDLIEENKNRSIEMYEGVKIMDDRGWTIVLPDHERPLVNIYTEGLSQEYANELSVFFSNKVKDLLKSEK